MSYYQQGPHNQFGGPSGGNGYAALAGLLFILALLFVFGMAIGLGIGAVS